METANDERWKDRDDVSERKVLVQGLSVVAKPGVLTKMFGWAHAADGEVSGLFAVKRDGSAFTILDAYIMPQTCTGTSTEIDPNELGKFRYKMHKKGIKPPFGHWHSHVNMDAFWSGTDVDNAGQMCTSEEGWSLCIVLNKKWEYLCRFDLYKPVRLAIDNITIGDGLEISQRDMARFKKDIAANVKSPVYTTPAYSTPHFTPGSYGGYGEDWQDPTFMGIGAKKPPVGWERRKRWDSKLMAVVIEEWAVGKGYTVIGTLDTWQSDEIRPLKDAAKGDEKEAAKRPEHYPKDKDDRKRWYPNPKGPLCLAIKDKLKKSTIHSIDPGPGTWEYDANRGIYLPKDDSAWSAMPEYIARLKHMVIPNGTTRNGFKFPFMEKDGKYFQFVTWHEYIDARGVFEVDMKDRGYEEEWLSASEKVWRLKDSAIKLPQDA